MADDINPRTATLARRVNSMTDRPALRQAGISIQEARQLLRTPDGQARLERAFSGDGPETRPGGGGGGGGRPPARVTSAEPPAPRGGAEVAPREGRAVARPATVIDGDAPRQPRYVPNTYQEPSLPGPQSRPALPAPEAPPAAGGAGRLGSLGRGALRMAGRALGPLGFAADTNEANPRGEREALDALRTPQMGRVGAPDPNDPMVDERGRPLQRTPAPMPETDAMGNPTGAPIPETAPRQAAPAAQAQAGTTQRRRMRGSVGRPQESEADALNAAMLRNLGVNEDSRGRALPISPSREAQVKGLIRRSEEGYKTGGVVKARNGKAIRGKTRGRFC